MGDIKINQLFFNFYTLLIINCLPKLPTCYITRNLENYLELWKWLWNRPPSSSSFESISFFTGHIKYLFKELHVVCKEFFFLFIYDYVFIFLKMKLETFNYLKTLTWKKLHTDLDTNFFFQKKDIVSTHRGMVIGEFVIIIFNRTEDFLRVNFRKAFLLQQITPHHHHVKLFVLKIIRT